MNTVLIREETLYNFETGLSRAVCKKGKKLKDLLLDNVNKGVVLKQAKKQDVKRLLDLHFGENWT